MKRHHETNAPAISSCSENALEEVLVRDATAARVAASYQKCGDLPYQRVGGPAHRRLDGPWSIRVLQGRRARYTDEVVSQASRPADYQEPEALTFRTGRGMLVELGLRPRAPSPDALPDKPVEQADEMQSVRLDRLYWDTERGRLAELDALPDETVELADELHLATLPYPTRQRKAW